MVKKRTPLYGLVLAGGKSTRMKKDKASLSYHGKPQVEIVYELLQLFCEKVFVSSRKGQKLKGDYQKILDDKKFRNIGPLGGILTATGKYPNVAWMVLACDLPFVDKETLRHLVRYRNPKKIATAYRSTYGDLPEPLCAIYEPAARKIQLEFLKNGIHCPRKILINSKLSLLKLKNKQALDNVNTQEEFKHAKSSLRGATQ